MDTPSISKETVVVVVRGTKEDHVLKVSGKSLWWEWPKDGKNDPDINVTIFEHECKIAEIPRYSVLAIFHETSDSK